MDNVNFTPNSMMGTLGENTMGFDLIDELLYDGCWLETTDGSNYWQQDLPISSPSNLSSLYLPSSDTKTDHLNPIPHQKSSEEEIERSNSVDNPQFIYPPEEELGGSQHNWEAIHTAASSSQSESETRRFEGTEMSQRLWIGPSGNPSPTTSMKKRLMQAVEYLKESTRERDVLFQIWVPIKRGGKHVLTTNNQPFSLTPNCKTLADYRNVSRSYQFGVEEDSKELLGLPGRVFLKKLPEWTPDVRFFSREEYPRINYAQQYNVSGCIALPVFQRGSGTCLGVVEIVTTTQKVDYRPELENVCKALQAVDLRSSEISSPPKSKDRDMAYQAALAEIKEVLKFVCDTHKLPLAQTWAPCTQQGKSGCRLSDNNRVSCLSIVDSACYVPYEQVLGFHEACSEHHLLRGEGVAGKAFMTNQLCFATDITAFSKTEYPLSHHARMFELRAAVAIRLQSIYTGSTDFILEFFLPLDCKEAEEQKQMLSSLLSVIQRICKSLHAVTSHEPVEEKTAPKLVSSSSKEVIQDESSWIGSMVEAQRKGKGVSVSLGYDKEELEEGFKVITHWNNNETKLHHGPALLEHKQNQKDSGPKGSAEGNGDFSSVWKPGPLGFRKAGEKRRWKMQRTISLEVLRQYFSGSLKDAAKSIGVCPTTLKRICRQHGITRWPSRKVKKVGHSLKKLQLVIDSVEGAEGAIQLGSFYTNFPELSSPKLNDHLMQLNTQPDGNLVCSGTTGSKSPSSLGSHSSSSSFCHSTRAIQSSVTLGNTELNDFVKEEKQFLLRSHDHKISRENPSLEVTPPLPKSSSQRIWDRDTFRVRATFAGEKIRFSMPQDWGLGDLQQEIVGRFNIDDISSITLKYLDDESEWILLTCDADLEECIDVHRMTRSHKIKLTVRQAICPSLGSSVESSGHF